MATRINETSTLPPTFQKLIDEAQKIGDKYYPINPVRPPYVAQPVVPIKEKNLITVQGYVYKEPGIPAPYTLVEVTDLNGNNILGKAETASDGSYSLNATVSDNFVVKVIPRTADAHYFTDTETHKFIKFNSIQHFYRINFTGSALTAYVPVKPENHEYSRYFSPSHPILKVKFTYKTYQGILMFGGWEGCSETFLFKLIKVSNGFKIITSSTVLVNSGIREIILNETVKSDKEYLSLPLCGLGYSQLDRAVLAEFELIYAKDSSAVVKVSLGPNPNMDLSKKGVKYLSKPIFVEGYHVSGNGYLSIGDYVGESPVAEYFVNVDVKNPDGKPVPGVIVTLSNGHKMTTDKNGVAVYANKTAFVRPMELTTENDDYTFTLNGQPSIPGGNKGGTVTYYYTARPKIVSVQPIKPKTGAKKLTIKVIDRETKQPIANAQVTIFSTKSNLNMVDTFRTDKNGEISLVWDAAKAGTTNVNVSADGYSARTNVVVPSTANSFTITLSPHQYIVYEQNQASSQPVEPGAQPTNQPVQTTQQPTGQYQQYVPYGPNEGGVPTGTYQKTTTTGKSNTMMYVGIGIAVLVILFLLNKGGK